MGSNDGCSFQFFLSSLLLLWIVFSASVSADSVAVAGVAVAGVVLIVLLLSRHVVVVAANVFYFSISFVLV